MKYTNFADFLDNLYGIDPNTVPFEDLDELFDEFNNQ